MSAFRCICYYENQIGFGNWCVFVHVSYCFMGLFVLKLIVFRWFCESEAIDRKAPLNVDVNDVWWWWWKKGHAFKILHLIQTIISLTFFFWFSSPAIKFFNIRCVRLVSHSDYRKSSWGLHTGGEIEFICDYPLQPRRRNDPKIVKSNSRPYKLIVF